MNKYYFYCLSHPLAGNEKTAPGLDFSGPVFQIKYKGISAHVSEIKDGDINRENLKELLEKDSDWAKRNILRHHRIIASVGQKDTVIPMKFGTVISSRKNLEQLLRDYYHQFKKLLKALKDRQEWGIKIYFESDRISSSFSRPKKDKKKSIGESWYEEKMKNEETERKIEQEIEKQLSAAIETLKDSTDNFVLNIPLPKRLDKHKGEMIINSSVLVKKESLPDFSEKIKKIQKDLEPFGLETELSGPWPPYNFVSMEKK